MALNVEIFVKGSVLVYCKDRVWHLLFVSDFCHQIYIKDGVHFKLPTPLGVVGERVKASFDHAAVASAADFDDDAKKRFLNMHGSSLHTTLDGESPRLGVYPKVGTSRGLLQISIPFGILHAGKDTNNEYFTQLSTSTSRTGTGKLIAKDFTIKYNVTDAEGMKLSVVRGSTTESYKYEPTLGTVRISLDNYCTKSVGYNDFIHHYDWLRDRELNSAGKPIRYLAGQIGSKPYPLPPEIGDGDVEPKPQPSEPKSSAYGDCDPAVIIPPPEPPV